ncbi:hypothetical protein PEDI_38500 [Persicobacter diffluens]|uniref:Thioredoxin domain-containing protein n=2 Tax=Persicobacter diffluens TaxID=981 RepID=A0AAN5ANY7_9BACT|nr:hypothetical protein PEDI_38500 [Persicobacter diffluens]
MTSCGIRMNSNEVSSSVNIFFPLAKDSVAAIYVNDGLSHIAATKSYKITEDSIAGNQPLSINISAAGFSVLGCGNTYTDLYLEPGYNLKIQRDTANQAFLFEGKGAQENIYWQAVRNYKVNKLFPFFLDKQLQPLDEYINFLQQYQNGLDSLHDVLLHSLSFSPENERKFFALNQCYSFIGKMEYAILHDVNDSESWKTLYQDGDFLLDADLLASNYHDYKYGLYYYYRMMVKTVPESKGNLSAFRAVADFINNQDFSEIFKEFFLATHITKTIQSGGITPEVTNVYEDFKKKYPESKYYLKLNALYTEFLNQLPGLDAKDIQMVNVDDEPVSLSDFKGKHLYIELWATWCGPCITEIPHLTGLQKKFSNDDEIVFIMLSLDQDKTKWKSFVQEKMTANCIQVILKDNQAKEEFFRHYNNTAIPRGILIDSNKKVVDFFAPRPSSKEAEELIERALLKM